MLRSLAVFGALLALVGCSNSTDSKPDSQAAPQLSGGEGSKNIRIAVIPKGTTHEFWKSVHAGAVNAAKEHGGVEILWKGPLQESDGDGQITVVTSFITLNVDGIVLAPLDSQALVPTVAQAKEAGIPVVIFDSGLDDVSNVVSYVATDNWNGGALAARRMGELLAGKGNVVMLRYKAGSESTTQREEGFLDTLSKEFKDIRILSSDQYAGTTPEESLTNALDVLNKHKDEINGIFAVCEPNAAGVQKALKELGLAGKVKFVAFDPNEALVEGLGDDSVHGIVLQDPVRMGYLAVQTMLRKLKNEEGIEARVKTGEYVATPENRATPDMKKLLVPEQFAD